MVSRAVADDRRRPADRGGHDLVVDDDHPQVLAGDQLLDQHVGAEAPGQRDRAAPARPRR